MWYVRDVLYAVLYVRVSCFVVHGCGVSSFGFRGEIGFLNCDDVCMCVVNKQFELLEFVSESVYVDMLEMSVVRGVGGVCDMCMCLARGGVGAGGVSG